MKKNVLFCTFMKFNGYFLREHFHKLNATLPHPFCHNFSRQ